MVKLTFGKYKGKEVKDCPSTYLAWLINPIVKDKEFPVPIEIRKEASELYEQKKFEENYIPYRLNGREGKETEYIVERLGDIGGLTIHPSLESALKQLEIEYPLESVFPSEWNELKEPTEMRKTPCPEDDRILIWEVLPSGHKKVVWHFSGWHWDSEEFGIEQGSLLGDKESLYGLASKDF